MDLTDLPFWTWKQLQTAIASIPDDVGGIKGYEFERTRQRLLAEQRYRQRRNYLGPAKLRAPLVGPGHSLNPKDLPT